MPKNTGKSLVSLMRKEQKRKHKIAVLQRKAKDSRKNVREAALRQLRKMS